MGCRVRYLSSAGIQPAEIAGVQALADAFPCTWLMYASLTCYPPRQHSFELDVVVVTHDRVLILELKELTGAIRSSGDIWQLGKKRRFRSPVAVTAEKARKVKGLLLQQIRPLAGVSVDHRIVLVGPVDFTALPDDQRDYCWTLAQACSIAQRFNYNQLLPAARLLHVKPCMLELDFDRVLGDPNLFSVREQTWDGYVTDEENTFVHPRGVWTEHRAQRQRDGRLKALLRLWNFSKLPAGLNVPEARRSVADREAQVIAHLQDADSWLVQRGGVLNPIASHQDEVLTQHFELFSLDTHTTSLRRFLERHHEALSSEQRLDLATALIVAVAELHRQGVAHRDLAPPCVWVGSSTRVALTGFMSAQVNENASVSEWLAVLRGYGEDLPEDGDAGLTGTAKRRDVFALGRLVREILVGDHPSSPGACLPDWAAAAAPVLDRAVSREPDARYADAVDMADAFGTAFLDMGSTDDTSRLDGHESALIPMAQWPPDTEGIKSDASKLSWQSFGSDGRPLRARIWPHAKRGLSPAVDLAILSALDGAARLSSSPARGLPKVEAAGLSMLGVFVVLERAEGHQLTDWSPPDPKTFALFVVALCEAVNALHDLGLTHADLSPQNIVVSEDPELSVTLIDLFDIPVTGAGRVRNLGFAPADWELLSDQQIDRFAAAKIIHGVTTQRPDGEATTLSEVLQVELDRPSIQSLEPIIGAARELLRLHGRPSPDLMTLGAPIAAPVTLETPEGLLWVSKTTRPDGAVSYRVSSYENQLAFTQDGGVLRDLQVHALDFRQLVSETRLTPTPLKVTVQSARKPAGFEALATKISTSAMASSGPAKAAWSDRSFNVPALWSRTVELEDELNPEILIKGRLGATTNVGGYQYESERTFDFDQESEIEVQSMHKGRMKRIGLLDLNRLSETELVINNQLRSLEAGDVVRLVDKRARVSLERRQRAVGRVLRREAAIPDLIDYFDPEKSPQPDYYSLDIADADLDAYELNPGQIEAFRNVLNTGPVGLLQGPPGTGKTHFIAALAHWLITRGGARKVLVASQSHEAVNNAAEGLIKVFRERGGRLDLLRIGSRGLSDRLRPYHTTSLRESFEQRFVASIKARVTAAGSALGVSRRLMHDLVDLDIALIKPLDSLGRLRRTLEEERLETNERRRLESRERGIARQTAAAATRWLDAEVVAAQEDIDALAVAARLALLARHPQSTPADMEAALRILALSDEWIATLRSGHRNFDEFLAKTKTVVAGTCVGLGQTRIKLEAASFDWVIIDEAARCTSSELAVPMQLGRRVLLVGDHLQLPPTVPHELATALAEAFPATRDVDRQRSDFERAFTSPYGQIVGQVLVEQYRMPPRICELVSRCFYKDEGVTLEPSDDRRGDPRFEAADIAPILSDDILWIDTAGQPDAIERRLNRDRDTWNEAEVEAIMRVLQQLSDATTFSAALAGDDDPAIGVICMYKQQKRKIEQIFAERPFPESFRRSVKIDTVDAYQGKQNKIVIVSLVRNNTQFDAGHVRRPHRCNVAFSRAQERLIIVGARTMWGDKRSRAPLRKALQQIEGGESVAPLGRVMPAGDIA